MTLIVDASIAVALAIEPGSVNDADRATIGARGGFVAAHWRLEVSNALTVSVRRKRMTEAQRKTALAAFEDLNLQVDPEGSALAFTTLVALADKHRLTIYDAAYLELALRKGLPLATLDGDLRKAAKAEGIELLPA
ncbi:MAG: type II toxin-antitoxin system VapC family toxin [Alphaproteobacteria bacterium]|nr:type II toxin-antitoxin system VapC family toxin [Alphaproteobacteria bacterium]